MFGSSSPASAKPGVSTDMSPTFSDTAHIPHLGKPITPRAHTVQWLEAHPERPVFDDPLDHRVEVDDRRQRQSFLCDPFAIGDD